MTASKEVRMSVQDLANMTNRKLLNHLDKCLNTFNEDVTVSEVQMTFVTFLGIEIGEIGDSVEEIKTNVIAYSKLMESIAIYTFQQRMGMN